MSSYSPLRPRRRHFYWSSLRPSLRQCFSLLVLLGFMAAFVCLRPHMPLWLMSSLSSASQNSNKSQRRINDTVSYEQLQQCVDLATSRGFWKGSSWSVPDHPASCGFLPATTSAPAEDNQEDNDDDKALASIFRLVKVGFLGDSTTRSDLRAWEEHFSCERTNLDEAQVFQLKDEKGNYICEPHEQSFNLTKCGKPPIIDVSNCPQGVSFRYFYKIYPWTPLDRWFLTKRSYLFQDLDVVVISMGRWFVYYQPHDEFNITDQFDTFLVELKKVYQGVILYQSEYTEHLSKSSEIQFPVACTPHAVCGDCSDTEQWECSQNDVTERPNSDVELRAVLERHRILHLDRWNVSKSLPLEYYQPWYCHNGTHNQWDCSHHLGVVAMQHMRLIANVIKNLFVARQEMTR